MANLLIVDDDELLSEHLQIHLETEGHKVQTATNADLAWRFIRGHSLHLILLDINMPGKNGLEFLKHLRNDDKYSSIPVIMISTNSKIETFKEARSIGIVDYIVKPAQPDTVSSKVRQAVQQLALLKQKEDQRRSEHLLIEVKGQLAVFTFPSNLNEKSLQYLEQRLDTKFREELRGKVCIFNFQYQEHLNAQQIGIVTEMQRLVKPNSVVFIAGRNYTILLALELDPENQLFISMDDFFRKVKPAKT